MYLNDLASVIRGAGMNVIEVSGWQNRNHGSLASVESIICHHTGTTTITGNFPSLGVVTNGRPDLNGPLAQLGLGRDGTVYVIANGVAWHAGATINDAIWGNTRSIGIEAENTGAGEVWPNVQVSAYAKLIAVLCKHYGLGIDRVRGHKEICRPVGRKIDPAGLPGDMEGLRGRVQAYMSGTNVTGKLLNGDQNMKLPVAMTTRSEVIALPLDATVKLVFAAPTTIFGGHIFFWSTVNGQGTGGDPVSFRTEVKQGTVINVPRGTVKAEVQYSCASEVDLYIQAIV